MNLDGYERFEPVIGLEVHCQLQTNAKLFSTAPAQGSQDEEPNTRTSPLDLGHPGTLPVLNERALELALRMGLATGCRVARHSTFVRKHYFYPDLPKGYQITQRASPLCYDGLVELPPSAGGDGQSVAESQLTRHVRLRRLHLEEDAGKSLHDRERTAEGESPEGESPEGGHSEGSPEARHRGAGGGTRLDFNRAGIPLIEIVTEPDLRTPHEAALFLKKIRRLVRYLGVSDGRMEAGSLRCDANISLRQQGADALGGRVELKNLNSFRHLERALRYEAARQARRLENGVAVPSETRRWDEAAGQTRLLREKESTPDYRYLPEPDLPPVVVKEARLEKVRAAMPEMPEERQQRFVEDIGLPSHTAALLTEDRSLADFYEETISRLYKLTGGGNTRRQAKLAAHFLTGEGRRALSEQPRLLDALPVTPARTAQLIYLLVEEEIDGRAAHDVFAAMLKGNDADPRAIAREQDLLQVNEREALAPVVDETLERHSKNVHRYKSGKKSLIGFFVGEVRAAFDDEGRPDPKLVRQMLEERLD